MKTLSFGPALLAAALLVPAAAAQEVGSTLYDGVKLDDLTATRATSFDDFQGRAVLIEFFAYW